MSAISISVARDDAGFRALETDWRALSDAVDATHFFQSFDWCWAAWQCISFKAGRRLRILVGRVDSQVVLILPLMIAGPFLRVLGSDLFEYHDVLVLPGPDHDAWLQAALAAAKRLGGSALLLRDVRDDGQLGGYLSRQIGLSRSRLAGKTAAIRLHDFTGWQAYSEAPGRLNRNQHRQWKRLRELPDPGRFELVEDPTQQLELLTWLRSEKIKFLAAKKGMSDGGVFGSQNYKDFLFAIVPILAAQGRVMMSQIVSGGNIMAGQLSFLSEDYFIFFIFAYDPQFSSYSAGRLLQAKMIEWCFSRNMAVFDMLLSEEYKAAWSNDAVQMRDYFLPLNLEGRLIEKWHASGCSNFFAKPWFGPISRIAPGRLRRAIGSRFMAQRELITQMAPL